MKKILTALAVTAVFSAQAQTISTQPVKPTPSAETLVAVVGVVLIVPSVITAAAALTGNLKPLCETWLQGTYVPAPQGVNVCPGGSWAVAVGFARPK